MWPTSPGWSPAPSTTPCSPPPCPLPRPDPFKTAAFPRGFLLLLHERALGSTPMRVLRDPLRPPLVLQATVLVRVARAGTRSQGGTFLEVTHSQESLSRGKSCEVIDRKYCPVFTVFHNRFSQVNQKLAKGGMISGPCS